MKSSSHSGYSSFTCCAQNKNRTCTPVTGTWPSTMRVYQFRHLGNYRAAKIKLFPFHSQII